MRAQDGFQSRVRLKAPGNGGGVRADIENPADTFNDAEQGRGIGEANL
jgi:hypothetical protein